MTASPANYPQGFFTEIDSIHVHVDGGVAGQLVRSVVDRLNDDGFPSKITFIKNAIAGPQRQDLPPTYQSHTPGTDDREELEYFSTTIFPDHSIASKELRSLLADLSAQNGIVIEAERVIGILDENTRWSVISVREFPVFHSGDVGFQRGNTLPIEVHLSCDIPKGLRWQEKPPLDLEILRDYCAQIGIRIGGWFLFEEADTWAFRSNMFMEAHISKEVLRRQRDEFAEILESKAAELGFEYHVRTLVEQSLGVWKTPLKVLSTPFRKIDQFKRLQDLAKWEKEFVNLERFWVVAPNFLGDIQDDVYEAMIDNLLEGVEYTYFLRSFADLQRLRQFTRRLVKDVPFAAEYIRAFLLLKSAIETQRGSGILHSEYFIANPLLPTAQGYQLIRSEDKEIRGGKLIRPPELDRITTQLQSIIEPSYEAQGVRVPLEPDDTERPVARAVIYTDLEGSTALQEEFGDDAWEQVLVDYDLIIAKEVSKLGGEVVKNLGDGYLLIFDQAGDALRFAERLQTAIQTHNSKITPYSAVARIPQHKIALDFGYVCRVMRAQGFDYTGKTLSRCARLVQQTTGDQVLMLSTFREHARTAFRHAWINERTKLVRTVEFKGLEGTYEIWEFLWKE